MPPDRSGATQGRPRSHADGPRRGPQRLKTAPRGPKELPEAPTRAWERIRSDSRAMVGPRNLKKPQKVLYCQRISWLRFHNGAFNRGPPSSKNGSREAHMRPKRARGGPRSGPRTARRATRGAPRGAQHHPGAQDPRGPKPPRRLQGALREPILTSSWGPRGLIFELPRRPFRASRAVRSTDESTGRNHWSKGLSRPLRARCTEAIVH